MGCSSNKLGQIKLDGASKNNPGHSGGGGILRDCQGRLLLAYGNYYGIQTSIWAKARVVCDGLKFIKDWCISHLWLDLDSLILNLYASGAIICSMVISCTLLDKLKLCFH